jgi:hypothetical protein
MVHPQEYPVSSGGTPSLNENSKQKEARFLHEDSTRGRFFGFHLVRIEPSDNTVHFKCTRLVIQKRY